MRRILNTQIIQKTISKLLRLSTYHCKLFLQYEWTPPEIFLGGYRVLQLLCHNVKGPHDINCMSKIAGTEIFLISKTWF